MRRDYQTTTPTLPNHAFMCTGEQRVVTTPTTFHSALSEEFKAWIHPYIIPPGTRDASKPETHVSLAGGAAARLSIPPDAHETWLKVYAAELMLNGHSLYIAERRTPVFRMHFDLDFEQPDPVPLQTLNALARLCTKVFRGFFGGTHASDRRWCCAVLMASPKRKASADPSQPPIVKSGCHLIWPWLYVNQVNALQLRANVVDMLCRTWPDRGTAHNATNAWDDVVDRTVLTSNGIRMMGSDKASKCKSCCKSLTARATCAMCDGRGILVENRAYKVAMVLDADGEPDNRLMRQWGQSLLTCVQSTCVRTYGTLPSPGWSIPPHAVTDAFVVAARKKMKLNAKRGGGEVGSVTKPSGNGGGVGASAALLTGVVTLEPTSRIVKALHAFLTQRTNPQWVGLRLVRVNYHSEADPGFFVVFVDGPGSSYCTHVGRAHGSSQIYFRITREGVYQKCFSPKTTNSSNATTCRAYTSDAIPLTSWLKEAMFGVGNRQEVVPVPPPVTTTNSSGTRSAAAGVMQSIITLQTKLILKKSAAYTKTLQDVVARKRAEKTAAHKTLEVVVDAATTDKPLAPPPSHNNHPVLTNLSCEEVRSLSTSELRRLWGKERNQRKHDTAAVFATEVAPHSTHTRDTTAEDGGRKQEHHHQKGSAAKRKRTNSSSALRARLVKKMALQ